MPAETKAALQDQTVDKLQKLIRANIDSYDCLREAADQVNDASVEALFRGLAEERSVLASELQLHVEWNGAKAEDDGSVAARMHRAWIDVRSAISGGNAHAILCEAERCEDHIKEAYEEVLKETAGSAVNDVLLSQYERVKAGHDQIRDLRDAYKGRG